MTATIPFTLAALSGSQSQLDYYCSVLIAKAKRCADRALSFADLREEGTDSYVFSRGFPATHEAWMNHQLSWPKAACCDSQLRAQAR